MCTQTFILNRDTFDFSYDLTDSQSFNRYAYVQNDPVNLVDPKGLLPASSCDGVFVTDPATGYPQCIPATRATVNVTDRPDPIGDAFGAGNGQSGWGGDGFGGPVGGHHGGATGGGGGEHDGGGQHDGKRRIGGDRLSDCLKNALAAYFPGLDLGNISIHHYIPLLPRYFSGPDGYTFKNDVYFKNYNSSSEQGFTLLVHELTHVVQFYRLTTTGFWRQYNREYNDNRSQGMSKHDAYYNISLEKEARENAKKIVDEIKSKNNGKIPCT